MQLRAHQIWRIYCFSKRKKEGVKFSTVNAFQKVIENASNLAHLLFFKKKEKYCIKFGTFMAFCKVKCSKCLKISLKGHFLLHLQQALLRHRFFALFKLHITLLDWTALHRTILHWNLHFSAQSCTLLECTFQHCPAITPTFLKLQCTWHMALQ